MEQTHRRNKLNFALLALFTFALASFAFANTTKAGSNVLNKTGTAIAATHTGAGLNTAIFKTGVTLAPDDNIGIVANTMAGNQNNLTSGEQACLKDVEQTTGTPPDDQTMATTNVQTGVPLDNLQMMAATNKTDVNGATSPHEEAILTAANAQTANQWMITKTTARGNSGTTDEAGTMPGNAEAANAHEGAAAAGNTADFVGLINAINFNC